MRGWRGLIYASASFSPLPRFFSLSSLVALGSQVKLKKFWPFHPSNLCGHKLSSWTQEVLNGRSKCQMHLRLPSGWMCFLLSLTSLSLSLSLSLSWRYYFFILLLLLFFFFVFFFFLRPSRRRPMNQSTHCKSYVQQVSIVQFVCMCMDVWVDFFLCPCASQQSTGTWVTGLEQQRTWERQLKNADKKREGRKEREREDQVCFEVWKLITSLLLFLVPLSHSLSLSFSFSLIHWPS